MSQKFSIAQSEQIVKGVTALWMCSRDLTIDRPSIGVSIHGVMDLFNRCGVSLDTSEGEHLNYEEAKRLLRGIVKHVIASIGEFE